MVERNSRKKVVTPKGPPGPPDDSGLSVDPPPWLVISSNKPNNSPLLSSDPIKPIPLPDTTIAVEVKPKRGKKENRPKVFQSVLEGFE